MKSTDTRLYFYVPCGTITDYREVLAKRSSPLIAILSSSKNEELLHILFVGDKAKKVNNEIYRH